VAPRAVSGTLGHLGRIGQWDLGSPRTYWSVAPRAALKWVLLVAPSRHPCFNLQIESKEPRPIAMSRNGSSSSQQQSIVAADRSVMVLYVLYHARWPRCPPFTELFRSCLTCGCQLFRHCVCTFLSPGTAAGGALASVPRALIFLVDALPVLLSLSPQGDLVILVLRPVPHKAILLYCLAIHATQHDVARFSDASRNRKKMLHAYVRYMALQIHRIVGLGRSAVLQCLPTKNEKKGNSMWPRSGRGIAGKNVNQLDPPMPLQMCRSRRSLLG
jgi:hypothetical protein